MANLADVIVDDASSDSVSGNSEAARKALTEAVTAPQQEPQTNTETQQADNDLPEKFRGKSVKDVVTMYQNLESDRGRMANELGVQRQLTDRLLGLKREDDLRANGGKPERAKPAPVTTNDLLDRPQETLERVVNDKVDSVSAELRQVNQQLRSELAKTRFENRHSDYQSVVRDPDFVSWVQASPLRLRAAAVANNGDWQIADELLTEYKQNGKQQSASRETDSTQTAQVNLEEARRASYTSSGSNPNDGQSKPAGKIYKRADLMRLMIDDPEAYYDEDFQREILLAHAEKRVR